MWQKRGPALLCLLLATALTVFAAARSPAAPPGEVPPPQTLEEESLLYEETPVQIISLLDLEPVDTRASANPVRVGGGTLDPVDQAEMASVLAECTLKDNTIVRLYVTAEGLIDGAFLRPGAGWIRFARLYRGADQGPNYAETAALTACSGILGHDGFLLRTDGHCSGVYSYDYYWFDTAGDLQVLTARMDPVALDLDGDGTAELVWEIAEWQGAFLLLPADRRRHLLCDAVRIHRRIGPVPGCGGAGGARPGPADLPLSRHGRGSGTVLRRDVSGRRTGD